MGGAFSSVDATPPGGAPPGTVPAVVAASRAVYGAIDLVDATVADRLGVHRSDLRCLNLLEQGARSPSDIAAALGLTSGAVTALIDRLERVGFARRVRPAGDRRAVLVELPPDAYGRVGRLYGTIAQAISAAFVEASADELTVAARALHTFADGCRAGVARIVGDAAS
jgi:DNA-binding MarR family transcriptional regulator